MQAKCRCGQELPLPDRESERVKCPRCGARVRVRRVRRSDVKDGFIRFPCPCGRRLKVSAYDPPKYGRCPECRRVVPVPESGPAANIPLGHPESPTEELNQADLAALDRWALEHRARSGNSLGAGDPNSTDLVAAPAPTYQVRAEAGLRVCPGCGQPVHLGADTCQECGVVVPRR
jgi:DNA-directed RNA polymerase subunit RPC12/RpoP